MTRKSNFNKKSADFHVNCKICHVELLEKNGDDNERNNLNKKEYIKIRTFECPNCRSLLLFHSLKNKNFSSDYDYEQLITYSRSKSYHLVSQLKKDFLSIFENRPLRKIAILGKINPAIFCTLREFLSDVELDNILLEKNLEDQYYLNILKDLGVSYNVLGKYLEECRINPPIFSPEVFWFPCSLSVFPAIFWTLKNIYEILNKNKGIILITLLDVMKMQMCLDDYNFVVSHQALETISQQLSATMVVLGDLHSIVMLGNGFGRTEKEISAAFMAKSILEKFQILINNSLDRNVTAQNLEDLLDILRPDLKPHVEILLKQSRN